MLVTLLLRLEVLKFKKKILLKKLDGTGKESKVDIDPESLIQKLN